jgi:hypothetical protein
VSVKNEMHRSKRALLPAIIMTGSVTGLLGNKNLLDYSMTKGGIHADETPRATGRDRARFCFSRLAQLF